jgi:hypothetical protein
MVADDGHVDQKGRLSTEAIGRRPANDRTDHGTENQGRTDEANHERAERKAARNERHCHAERKNGETVYQCAAAR